MKSVYGCVARPNVKARHRAGTKAGLAKMTDEAREEMRASISASLKSSWARKRASHERKTV